MKILQASVDHLDELTFLFDSYRIFYRLSPDPEAEKKFLRERIENEESIVYVAVDDSECMVGFAQLYPLFSSTRMKRLWLLNDLFVKPDHRGKGIGKLLIEKCKVLARETNAAGLSLETEKNNLIGNYLYPSTGFEVDIQHNYYFWINHPKPL